MLHLVDKDNFDPILPAGNPFTIVSPQKYADERITSTEIVFYDHNYKSESILSPFSFKMSHWSAVLYEIWCTPEAVQKQCKPVQSTKYWVPRT